MAAPRHRRWKPEWVNLPVGGLSDDTEEQTCGQRCGSGPPGRTDGPLLWDQQQNRAAMLTSDNKEATVFSQSELLKSAAVSHLSADGWNNELIH